MDLGRSSGLRWLVAGMISCGSAGAQNGGDEAPQLDAGADAPSTGGDVASDAGTLLAGDAGPSGPDASADCPKAATLVYVTGPSNQLWSFYPPTLEFTLVGTFDCLSFPTHMTVDRQGSAWVVSGGQLYKASTADATCQAVPTWAPNVQFPDFALTFIGTSGVDDTLYLMATKLGRFDVTSGAVTLVGSPLSPQASGDMTSAGDGTLYFLWDETTPTLYGIDPTNASVISTQPLAAKGGGDQALAFWGGSFWAFENDTIFEYDPVKKTTTARGTAPLTVSGAGQSTCVPKTPPAPQ